MAVAADLRGRSRQRRRLDRRRQRLDLVLGVDAHKPVGRLGLAIRIGAGVAPFAQALLAGRAPCPDADRPPAGGHVVGPFLDAVAQIEPGAKSGHARAAVGCCRWISSTLRQEWMGNRARARSHACQPALVRNCSTEARTSSRSWARRCSRSALVRGRLGFAISRPPWSWPWRVRGRFPTPRSPQGCDPERDRPRSRGGAHATAASQARSPSGLVSFIRSVRLSAGGARRRSFG